jgi:hypothetical protein
MERKQIISALTSALYRLVQTIDEVNTYNLHFDRNAVEEAAAEIWIHLAEARELAREFAKDVYEDEGAN